MSWGRIQKDERLGRKFTMFGIWIYEKCHKYLEFSMNSIDNMFFPLDRMECNVRIFWCWNRHCLNKISHLPCWESNYGTGKDWGYWIWPIGTYSLVGSLTCWLLPFALFLCDNEIFYKVKSMLGRDSIDHWFIARGTYWIYEWKSHIKTRASLEACDYPWLLA